MIVRVEQERSRWRVLEVPDDVLQSAILINDLLLSHLLKILLLPAFGLVN